jgi:O-antigen/teichoic acid export membrane protein
LILPSIRKISENTIFLFTGQFLGLAFSLLSYVLLARYLTETRFGTFSYALVIVGFFALIPDFGMKPIQMREIARAERQSEIIDVVFSLKIFLSIIAILAVNIFSILFYKDPFLRTTILILSLTILISSKTNSIRSLLESAFNVHFDSKYVVYSQIIDYSIQLIVIVILMLFKREYLTIITGYVLSNFCGLIFMLVIYYNKHDKITFKINFKKYMWIMVESFPLFVYLISIMCLDRFDILVIGYLGGEDKVGLYASAFRLVTPMIFIPYAITYSLYPLLSSKKHEVDIEKLFIFGLDVLMIFGLVLSVLSVTIGNELFKVLFGKTYESAAQIFQLLTLGQLSYFIVFYLIDFHNSQDRQKICVKTILITLMIAVPIQIILIRQYSLMGAGVSKVILYYINLIVITVISKKTLTNTSNKILAKYTKWIGGTLLAAVIIIKIELPLMPRIFLLVGFLFVTFNTKLFKNTLKKANQLWTNENKFH